MADLAADGDGGPGDGLALADRVPERAGCHRDGDRGAGPAGHAEPGGRDRSRPGGPRAGHAPKDRAGPDDLGVFQVPADAREEVLGGGNNAAELAGLGGGCPHAEHDADDGDRTARDYPDGSKARHPPARELEPGLDAYDPVVPETGIDVIRHPSDRRRDLRHGHDLAERRNLQRAQGEPELVADGADRGRVRPAGVRVPRAAHQADSGQPDSGLRPAGPVGAGRDAGQDPCRRDRGGQGHRRDRAQQSHRDPGHGGDQNDSDRDQQP